MGEAVPFADRDLNDHRLAELITQRDVIQLEKDESMRLFNKRLKDKDDEISALAKAIMEGPPPQRELFPAEATRVLADVASRVEGSEAFAFDANEPPPAAVSTHPAIDVDKADRDEPEPEPEAGKKRGRRRRAEASH